MKTIGLIGGLSWQSSTLYYRYINEEVNNRLGENHSARIILYSFDFQEIEHMQNQGIWDQLCQKLVNAASILEKSGADLILICSNTMHRCFDEIRRTVSVPVLHIAESSGRRLARLNIRCTGLLGTRFLIESAIYPEYLTRQFDIEVLIPSSEQIDLVNSVIYKELVKGIIRKDSRRMLMEVIEDLISRGAQSVVLGCTEIPLLIRQEDCPVPVIDTTYVHALSSVDTSLRG